MFAFSNAQYGDAQQMLSFAQKLSKRFPQHEGVTSLLKALDSNAKKESIQYKAPGIGDEAPDFTCNDVHGKAVSLSSFRGKYVLVDFWASWCGPCRGENPNVLAAYKKYSNKNFTVLGVSLDEKKADWLEAIQEDGLTWTHISDLRGWESNVVPQYGFDGIPYNVLVDPSGKILATSLRGDDLEQFLGKTLK
jgi:peroxiredoxin